MLRAGFDVRTRATVSAGPDAPMPRSFIYDAATVDGVAMPYAKGRLAEACTGSAVNCGSTAATQLGFGYSARGEPTDTYTWTTDSGGSYHENVAYWVEYGMPNILNFYSPAGAQSFPTISYGVDGEGRLNSVSASGQNPVTSATYAAAGTTTCQGVISNVTYGSGDSDTFQCDPYTGCMTQYSYEVSGQPVTGNLTWNANGTLDKLAITDSYNSATVRPAPTATTTWRASPT